MKTNAELAELNARRKIGQIAFLVHDVEKAMKKWVDLLNIGPWNVLVMDHNICTNVIENGQPSDKEFKFICAVTMVGDIQIELIEPCYGVELYENWLKENGEGLHHFKEYIPNERIAETVKEYAEKGMPVIRGGHYLEDIHLYIDSLSQLGFQLELGNCAECSITEDMYYVFPREK